MTDRPLKPCAYPGCGELTTERHCDACKPRHERHREANADRTHHHLYDTKAWRDGRVRFLIEHPMCATDGCGQPSTEVDHIIDHRGDRALFFKRENWQALCKPCHSRKTRDTMRQRGAHGFG